METGILEATSTLSVWSTSCCATLLTGDSALSIAYQRLDADVPRASAVIDGVPPQFDELVVCAARNSCRPIRCDR